MAHAGSFGRRQFERVVLVIVPPAQIDRIALSRGLRHAHHIDEKLQAFVRLRRQEFHVAEMREIENRFRLHKGSSSGECPNFGDSWDGSSS